MKRAFNYFLAALLLFSTSLAAQDPSVFPGKLDPEGLSRSSNLVPPPILSDQSPSTNPRYRVANTQDPQSWDSTTVGDNTQETLITGPAKIRNEWTTQDDWSNQQPQIIGEKVIGTNTESHASPLIRIETITPAEASTYIDSNVTIRVSNQGPTLAESVELAVEFSRNVNVIATQPANVAAQNGKLYFKLGDLENGEASEVQLTVKATAAGEILVRPRVSLAATSQSIIKAIQPSVEVRMIGEGQIIAGTGVTRQIELRNTGREAIRNLRISSINANDLLSNIVFTGENQMIEWLAPGESRRFELEAAAVAPGTANITFGVIGDNIRTEFKNSLTIAQRTIQTELTGPELTYKNSTGTFAIDVANEAPVDAENVQIVLDLPKNMDIKAVDREAHYNRNRTKLTWTIPRLEAGRTETIPFKAAISSTGSHKLKVAAVSNRKVISDSAMDTHVVGRANLNLQVLSTSDAVEIGSTTLLNIKISNDGSEEATNVRLNIQLPDSVRAIPTAAYKVQDDQIIVAPFDLDAGRNKTLQIQVMGVANGEFVVRATAASDSTSTDISAEKNLFFFSGSKN